MKGSKCNYDITYPLESCDLFTSWFTDDGNLYLGISNGVQICTSYGDVHTSATKINKTH